MGNVAFITGGTRGIGLGIAHCLADNGFDLAINGMRPYSEVEKVLNDLRSKDIRVVYFRGDIGDKNARISMIEQAVNFFGRFNVLVNNAGVAPKERNDILNATEESFDYVLNTNLKGTYFLSQLAANAMVQFKRDDAAFHGCIVNITSVSAEMASTNRGEYCVAKAGLSMMSKLFAVRLGEYDLPVYEVQPGVIATDMTAGVKEKYDKMFGEGLAPQRRWGQPDDVGKVVAALAKGELPYATGQIIRVDGGIAVQRL